MSHSDAPAHTTFAYTFTHITDIVDELTSRLGATRYVMYVMDHGVPVGCRLALKQPERVSALVVQNGNAYLEGLGELWPESEPLEFAQALGPVKHLSSMRAREASGRLLGRVAAEPRASRSRKSGHVRGRGDT